MGVERDREWCVTRTETVMCVPLVTVMLLCSPQTRDTPRFEKRKRTLLSCYVRSIKGNP